jgi:hypothetical protein
MTMQDNRSAGPPVAPEEVTDHLLDALGAGDDAAVQRLAAAHPDLGAGALAAVARQVSAAVAESPSPATRARHVQALMEEAARLAPAPRATTPVARTRRAHSWGRRVLVTLCALAGLAVVAVPATAALAANAQPGQALYGTKLAFENVQLTLQRDPAKKVALRLKFAEERLAEIQKLVTAGKAGNVDAATANLSTQQAEIATELGRLASTGRAPAALLRQLDQVLQRHAATLRRLATSSGCDLHPLAAGCRSLTVARANTARALRRLVGITATKPGSSGA